MNGFQDPDVAEPDGATKGKKSLNADMQIDDLGNYLGVSLSVTPLRMVTKSVVVEGEDKTQYSYGGTGSVGIFAAGTINKNLSIFAQFSGTQTSASYSWYYLGIHRVFAGTLGNFQIGNISPLAFASVGSGDALSVASSNGSGEDPVNSTSARHGLQWYGWKGPITAWAGMTPGGTTANDVNDKLHLWAAARYDLLGGSFEGTNATIWYYGGTNAKNTSTFQATSAFSRLSPQLNVRVSDWDILFAYVMGSEDNWTLVPDTVGATPMKEVAFSGMTLGATYNIGKWYPSIQLSTVTSDDEPNLERTFVSPAITYLWKENIRFGLNTKFDLRKEVKAADATADKPAYTPKTDISLSIRFMI